MKVLVCDYVGNSAQWLQNFTLRGNFEIVETLTPDSDKKLMAENFWDYLLIFENGARNIFDTMAQFMKIDAKKIIYALDWNSWAAHPAAVYSMLNPQGGGYAYRLLTFNTARQFNYFTTCTTKDGFSYISTSNDLTLMRPMYLERKNYAEYDMKLFHALAKKFYGVDDGNGYFLDLGANIGTTGIYFTKKIAPNLKLLAFEPDPENFKLLRANLILNDAEENTVVENYGLGVEEREMTMYRDVTNPGHNGMYSQNEGAASETVKIIPLDKYFDENNLSPAEVKYIWIDTEGFEPQVLMGAQNILRENPAPIFMEFNPQFWQSSGFYDKMLELLSELYESFIWSYETMKNSKAVVRPIENLRDFQNSKADFGVLRDIFLIKKS